MILLCDIGNTHTHLGLANSRRVVRNRDVPTRSLSHPSGRRAIHNFLGQVRVEGTCICTVVPQELRSARKILPRPHLILTARSVTRVGIDYPFPESIGPDRLANAVAARVRYGAPSLVVDFGTAVTFDVVDRAGNYVGGIIAPGLAAMTDYLHEKTALLPRIRIRDTDAIIGKSTEQAMLVGAVHGYRGLVHELIVRLKRELRVRSLPVVATGGCAKLIASGVADITAVEPLLTLDGLRIVWQDHHT